MWKKVEAKIPTQKIVQVPANKCRCPKVAPRVPGPFQDVDPYEMNLPYPEMVRNEFPLSRDDARQCGRFSAQRGWD